MVKKHTPKSRLSSYNPGTFHCMIRNQGNTIESSKCLNQHLSGDRYQYCGILKGATKSTFEINRTKRVWKKQNKKVFQRRINWVGLGFKPSRFVYDEFLRNITSTFHFELKRTPGYFTAEPCKQMVYTERNKSLSKCCFNNQALRIDRMEVL